MSLFKVEKDISISPEAASVTINEIKEKASKIGYQKGYFKAIYHQISLHTYSRDYPKCVKVFEELNLDSNNFNFYTQEEYGSLLRLITLSYCILGKNEEAQKFSTKCLEIFNKLDNRLGLLKIKNLQGLIYINKKDYNSAFVSIIEIIEELKKVENLTEEERHELSTAYNNIAVIFKRLDNYVEAKTYLLEAINVIKNSNNNRLTIHFYNELGEVYIRNNEIDEAFKVLTNAKKYCSESNFPIHYVWLLVDLALCHYLMGDYQKAFDITQQCKSLEDKTKSHKEIHPSISCIMCVSLIKLNKTEEALDLYNSIKKELAITSIIYQEVILEELIEVFKQQEKFTEAFEVSYRLNQINKKNKSIQQNNNIQQVSINRTIHQKEKELIQQKILLEKEKEIKSILQKEYENQRYFINMLSHDLKAPIRNIDGFSKMIKKYLDKAEYDKALESLEFVFSGVVNIKTIVNDLLNFALAGKVNEAPKPINLNTILDKIIGSIKNDLSDKNGTIKKLNELQTVLANETPMLQLFQNLIGNALKYSKENVAPKIAIQSKETNNFFQVSISDNGLGIAQDMLEIIFEPFKRNHINNKVKGYGLGLASCKKIVESYNGEIWVISEVGVGSTFHFTISKESKTPHDTNSPLLLLA